MDLQPPSEVAAFRLPARQDSAADPHSRSDAGPQQVRVHACHGFLRPGFTTVSPSAVLNSAKPQRYRNYACGIVSLVVLSQNPLVPTI